MPHFADRLAAAVLRCGNPVLVGLDPRFENLPSTLRKNVAANDWPGVARAYRDFCCEIIATVADLVPAVKPQAAFFEQLGPAGMQALAEVIAAARKAGLLVILDGKRNDIGTTATAYAQAYLGAPPLSHEQSGKGVLFAAENISFRPVQGISPWGADALTVSPYLGDDSLAPFVDVAREREAGIFVLVKTSNPGGGLFQDLVADGRKLFEHVADYVEGLATQTVGECGYGAVGAVVGATYPEQLAELRQRMPHTYFLVPGFGAQGGAAKDVRGAFDERGLGGIINNSRALIFAHEREPFKSRFGESRWQEAVAAATRDMIEQLRYATP